MQMLHYVTAIPQHHLRFCSMKLCQSTIIPGAQPYPNVTMSHEHWFI